MAIRNEWYVFSSRGIVLSYIAINPDCTVNDIAETLCLTRRTVWGLVGNLRQADMVHVRREGRRHHYTVNLDAKFLHPALSGYTLRPILGGLVEHARRRVRAAWTTGCASRGSPAPPDRESVSGSRLASRAPQTPR